MIARTVRSLLLFSVVTYWGSGCAFVVCGTKQKIKICSEPSGATAKVADFTVTTPDTVILRRGEDYTIAISKEGFETRKVYLYRDVNPWVWGNILVGGVLGVVVDYASSSGYVLVPTTVNVKLNAVPTTVTIPALSGTEAGSPTNAPPPTAVRSEQSRWGTNVAKEMSDWRFRYNFKGTVLLCHIVHSCVALFAAGCTSYYAVTDPASNTKYYTSDWDTVRGGATRFADACNEGTAR